MMGVDPTFFFIDLRSCYTLCLYMPWVVNKIHFRRQFDFFRSPYVGLFLADWIFFARIPTFFTSIYFCRE